MNMKLCKNECKKNFNIKQFVVIVTLMLLINVAGIFIYENQTYDNWREYATEKREEYLEYIDADDAENITEVFRNEIMLIDYHLEHNIPYGTTGIWKHLNRMIGLFSVIVVMLTYLNSKVFLCEYECNTWKNLFCTETEKYKIFVSKIIFCLLTVVAYLAIYFMLGAICGVTLGMENGMVEVSVEDGQIVERNLIWQIAVSYGLMILQMLFYLALMVMAVLFVREKKLVIILPVLIMFLAGTINQWIGDRAVADILPFTYLERISEISAGNIIKACVVLGFYSLLLLAVACMKFKKDEVVSG